MGAAGRRASLAASGAIVIAGIAAASWLLFARIGRPSAPPPVRPITGPEVPAAAPLLLAWEGGGPPFRLTLSDARGHRLWSSGRLDEPIVRLPAAVQQSLRPGEPLQWWVEGFDGRGRSFRSGPFPLRLREQRPPEAGDTG